MVEPCYWRQIFESSYEDIGQTILPRRVVIACSISVPPRKTTKDIALDKLSVHDGKGVLTYRLKYFHTAISLPGVH